MTTTEVDKEAQHILMADEFDEPMFELAVECGHKFEKALIVDDTTDAANMKRRLEEYERLFWTWAQYVGVFAPGKASLDWRLRRNREYRDLFLLALDLLRVNLLQNAKSIGSEGSDSSEDEDPSGVAIEGIRESISQLNNLGMAIRSLSKSRLESKVNAFAARRMNQLNEFETLAMLAIERLYPDAAPSLLQKLSKNMVNIYARLLYWKSHESKLGIDRRTHGQMGKHNEQIPSAVAPSHDTPLSTVLGQKRKVQRSSTIIGTEATTVPSRLPIPQNRDGPKGIRGGQASTVVNSKVDIPPPPRDNDGNACWYCRKIHSAEDYMNRSWWRYLSYPAIPEDTCSPDPRNHTNEDLLPFMCLSDSCLGPKSFPSSGAWDKHMSPEHGDDWAANISDSPIWRCGHTEDHHSATLHFSTLDDFQEHWSSEHTDSRAPQDSDHSIISETPVIACPLCYMTLGNSNDISFSSIPAISDENSQPRQEKDPAPQPISKQVKWAVDVEDCSDRSGEDSRKYTEEDNRHYQGRPSILKALSSHIAEHLQRLALLALRLKADNLGEGDGDGDKLSSRYMVDDGMNTGNTRSTIDCFFAGSTEFEGWGNDELVSEAPESQTDPDTNTIDLPTDQSDRREYKNTNKEEDTGRQISHGEQPDTTIVMREMELQPPNDGQQKDIELQGKLARLLDQVAEYRSCGRWEEAGVLQQKVLETSLVLYGGESQETMAAMRVLASIYNKQLRHTEEVQLLERVVNVQQATLPADHPDTTITMMDLAIACQCEGLLSKSENILQLVLESRTRTLGTDHRRTITTKMALALAYRDQGKLLEAEQLLRQVLDAYEQTLGDEHTDTATVMNGIALVLQDEGKLEEAEQLLRRVCDILKKVFGKDHFGTANAMEYLARVLKEQGRTTEADNLLLRSYEILRKVFGDEHTETTSVLEWLSTETRQRLAATRWILANRRLYTVAWFCTSRTEHDAARLFLDEVYEETGDIGASDTRTFGRVHTHHVAIVDLSAVKTSGSLASAVEAAKKVFDNLPAIRAVLMVGCGYGAPSRAHDIRLGDVVVGTSALGESIGGAELIKYDFKRTMRTKALVRECSSSKSLELLRAISGLKGNYTLKGSCLDEKIGKVLETTPRFKEKFRRPSDVPDRLYESTFPHPQEDQRACTEVCGDSLTRSIRRPPREDDEPAFHYGPVASSSMPMMDAEVRDRLTTKEEILCFDADIAGLVGGFPCAVIRGIWTYADTHRTEEWKGYAAMAAAAYAKDLLEYVKPGRLEMADPVVFNSSASQLRGKQPPRLARFGLRPPVPPKLVNKKSETRPPTSSKRSYTRPSSAGPSIDQA